MSDDELITVALPDQAMSKGGLPIDVDGAGKQWAAVVRGFDPDSQYKWDHDFLDDHGDVDDAWDVSPAEGGDVLRVNSSSGPVCFRVADAYIEDGTDFFDLEQLSDDEAKDAVTDKPYSKRQDMLRGIQQALEAADPAQLERLHEWITSDPNAVSVLQTTDHPLYDDPNGRDWDDQDTADRDSDEWPDWMNSV